ncbi:23S rRNA (uracil(1939)-C(5))-methyltransferase RlmD [Glaciecola sp. SC05]|uniref:23S rRNA (uracil(1939)-C(5))-methyltransferase RlmD n=1 Tax=Glaciecola sp. SC05 TaxID=1987355 RepID=UPI00352807CB
MVQFYKAPGSAKGKQSKKHQANHSIESSVYIDVLDQHGHGIALSTQPITIVEGALPKETVSVSISSASKSVRRGKVVKVHSASEHRIKARCPVYDSCGGCSLQNINAQMGLAFKRDALMRYFDTQLDIDKHAWKPSILSDIDYSNTQQNIGYRRKVRLAVDARNINHVKIGYRQHQSNKVVDINSCPILQPKLAQKLGQLFPKLKALACIQRVGHFECTQTFDGLVLLVNLSKPITAQDLSDFKALGEISNVRILCRYKDNIVGSFSESSASLAIEDLPSLRLDIAEHHFIQVNAFVNRQMIVQALAWLAPNAQSVVRDFFCGIGNFSLPLAKQSAQVIGYEVSESMVAQAQHNARLNGIENTLFEAIDLSDQTQLLNLHINPSDLVLLDPSREGAQGLCELLIKQAPAKIVYVSCNPNTLARDLKILSTRYNVNAVNVIDMFPFTQHLETMTMLELK